MIDWEDASQQVLAMLQKQDLKLLALIMVVEHIMSQCQGEFIEGRKFIHRRLLWIVMI